jgi:divinyl protochlorophyllide a 8-vinyl-reductase
VSPGAGRIGPNVLIQTAQAISHRYGRDVAARMLAESTEYSIDTLPPDMVPEGAAHALMARVMHDFGGETARRILRESGHRTGDYLLANRIPRIARILLPRIPRPVALRILLHAISRHTWTFAGSARVDITPGTPAAVSLTGCPLCAGMTATTPVCDFYTGTFERLAQTLLGPDAWAEEVACVARGDAWCSFTIGITARAVESR